MKQYTILVLLFFCIINSNYTQAQDSIYLKGTIVDAQKSMPLNQVYIQAQGSDSTIYKSDAISQPNGQFEIKVPADSFYTLLLYKQAFGTQQIQVIYPDNNISVSLKQQPGYLLDASIIEDEESDIADGSAGIFAVDSCTIEVYNNTLQREELRLVNHPAHNFSFFMEQGNEYIFMIRRKGYYTKRMRANVNVNDCILCMEGFGTVSPGVVDYITENNTKGVLSGDVKLKPLKLNETVLVNNIYYDLGHYVPNKFAMTQLDLLAEMLSDNPEISIELSSHTDCRGSSKRNQELSQKRADYAVDYIVKKSGIEKDRIEAKGYGETRLVNSCSDGVECSEEMHSQNRRTEFTVIDIRGTDEYLDRSLASMMQEENFNRQLSAAEQTYIEENTAVPAPASGQKVNPPQVIPLNYNGYKIQLFVSSESPTLDNPVFGAYEYVYLEVVNGNQFAFLMGDYEDKARAEKVLEEQLKYYPKAELIKYENSVRQ